MKAIVYRRFGSPDRLSCEEIPKPAPGDDEVAIRVRAASVNPLDWHMLRGTPRMMRLSRDLRKYRPMRPGRDVAGEVESVGRDVKRFRPGDAVFGVAQGAFAETVCGREDDLAAKPAGLSFEDAAALPIAGLTALQALRDSGGLRAGRSVLVNGASGGVGTFAVQLAGILEAQVTGVCATDAVELVRRLGATRVVDYKSEDFTKGAERYDLILDLIGNHPFRRLKRVLAPRGRVVAVGGGGPGGSALGRWMGRVAAGVILSRFARQRLLLCISKLDLDDLATLGSLAEEGRLKPVIDRRYGLGEVPDALRHVAQGHARGKVVILPVD